MSARLWTDRLWPFVVVGALFGVVLIKSEVVSWYRIQEMFRFDSFHMYGVIGSAIVVAAASRRVMGEASIWESPRPSHLFGGVVFGLGWGLTGACPGPLFALVGFGLTPYLVVLVGALLGTWAYGVVVIGRPKPGPEPTSAFTGYRS